jgi:RNA polymerase sigma factor (sigma-70 family)
LLTLVVGTGARSGTYAGNGLPYSAGSRVAFRVRPWTAFLQAWRRWSDVPDQPLPWLLSTARKTIANQRRSRRRRVALEDRISALDQVARMPDDGELVEARAEALTILASLPDIEREALLLVVWDGLTSEQAAMALGIRPGALRVRLHRARRRLVVKAKIDDDMPPGPPPHPSD